MLVLLFISGVMLTSVESRDRPAFLSEDASYLWPTNASRYMSSSFGETRSAHFHAAMDIGTWGHEGYAVYATRDGIVHRVAASPFGYGNVIYLRHADNTISLYAHLKDFHPEIRTIVDSLRLQDYSSDFDQNMESYEIYFQRGEQIGWTGSTGVGPPHLHFELRTPGGKPFNPLLAGIRIEDTIAPRFSGIAIEPLSGDSKINSQSRIYRSRPDYQNGQFHFGTVDVQGEVGIAVNVFDRANASNNTHAVYELSMYVNNERYFHSRADSFSFSQTRQMFLDRVFPILAAERRGYQRLYVRAGNTLPFYSDTGHSGRLRLPPGIHQIRIEASDYFNNRAVATLRLNVSDSVGPENIRKKINMNDSGTVTHATHPPRGLHWHKNWVIPRNGIIWSDRGNGESGPTASADSDNHPDQNSNSIFHGDSWSIRPAGSFQKQQYEFIYHGRGLPLDIADRMELRKNDSLWILHRIVPGNPLTLHHDNMRLEIRFPAHAFFEPVTLGIAGDRDAFFLFPNIEPFHQPATVRILLDENRRNIHGLGIYRKNQINGRLTHVSSFRNARGNTLVGAVRSGGYYVIRSDTTAPEIANPEIGRWRHSGLHYVTVSVNDELSGIDHRSAEFYVNGRRGIAEYDPEKQLLRYHHPDFTPNSNNELLIRISDRAGNMSEQTFSDVPYN